MKLCFNEELLHDTGHRLVDEATRGLIETPCSRRSLGSRLSFETSARSTGQSIGLQKTGPFQCSRFTTFIGKRFLLGSRLGVTPHHHIKVSSTTRGLQSSGDGDQRRVRRVGSQTVNASGSRRRTTATFCARHSSRLSWAFQNGDCCKHHRRHRYHQLCSSILVLYIDRDHVCRRSCHNNDSLLRELYRCSSRNTYELGTGKSNCPTPSG